MARFKLNSKESFSSKSDQEKAAIISGTIKMMKFIQGIDIKNYVLMKTHLEKREQLIKKLEYILVNKEYDMYIDTY